ncbi:hypothetical protein HKD37_19G053051 [Glycine soja]
MEAIKEQMATMMKAMMSMKKIMEANAVIVAAISAVAKVNSMLPSGLKQMNHPTSNMAHISQTMGETHEIPHHNLADFEPWLGYATEGQAVGGIPFENTLESPQFRPQPQPLHFATHYRYSTMKRWWAAHPQSFADLVFASERINVGPKRGKFDHPTRTTEKTGANKEGEDEGETHAMTAIPVRPSFPPTQQYLYSANNKLSPYPPPSYPQRPSLNLPQTRKPVEFTPIPVSYADLLPYLLDNSMVAITLAKVHQPPFIREYDSNATCACHGEAPGRSIEHSRALKRKVQGLIDAGWLKFEENCV